MTPEQRANELIARLRGGHFFDTDLHMMLTEMIQAAVLAERERIKQVIEQEAKRYSATNAVDEATRDFLTGAETALGHALAAIRSA